MENKYRLTKDEKAGIGITIGATIGVFGGLGATIIGGYELGSAVNDTMNLQNNFGRFAVDFAVGTICLVPALYSGVFGGVLAGGLTAYAVHDIGEGIRNLSGILRR